MEFSVNHPILFVIVGAIIALVLAQSIYFLVRALKRARQLGIEKSTLGKIISSAAIFTIAPAVAILVVVVSLSKSLGLALPWLRLSVIGNLQYEVNVADIAARGIGLSGLIDRDDKKVIEHPAAHCNLDSALKDYIIECPWLLKSPIVRNGNKCTIGYQPDVWDGWAKE